jgi:hypothetical protein
MAKTEVWKSVKSSTKKEKSVKERVLLWYRTRID